MSASAKVLVAPDKFKGSLTAVEVADHLGTGLRTAAPEVDLVQVPVADGGDGTLDAAVSAGYRRVPVSVTGPTGERVDTAYAINGETAVIELADACGLQRLPGGGLAPLTASSSGLGEVLRAALDAGCSRVVIGVGGSASTDGGAGMLVALGARLLDASGAPLPPGGAALERLASVDLSGLHPAVGRTEITLASDVDNPLLGPRGAAAVYAPQKGAGPEDVRRLEAALARWSRALSEAMDVPVEAHGHPAADLAGAGAAGGVGFAALAALGARARPGIELLLDLTGFAEKLPGSALVLTGEGSLDTQTLAGKAPAGVAAAAAAASIPVVAVAGRCLLSAGELEAAGIVGVYTLADLEPDLSRSMKEAGVLLERLAQRVAEDWLTGSGTARHPHGRHTTPPGAGPLSPVTAEPT